MEQPVISLKDVTKVYTVGTQKLRALDGVDLDINRGEFTCIIGRSGSGKSTLLNLMAGLERPTRGSIVLNGRHIERLGEGKLVQLRLKYTGFIFQSFNLFPTYTALDNVAMPLMYKGVDRLRRTVKARQMLKTVGLEEHLRHLPSEMSGGQQQRTAIARALVTEPMILFADEPTGNLDTATSAEILELLRSACRTKNTTLIMVTHDNEIARTADRVITILDGRITGDERNPSPADR